MKALKLAAASALIVGVGVGLFVLKEREATRGSDAPPTGPASATPAPRLADHRVSTACTFSPGERFSYAATAQTSWRLPERLRAVVGAQSTGSSGWSAELHFEVLANEPEGAVVLARLTDSARGAEEGIDRTWLARINSACEVAGFAHHRETSQAAARAQQTALHELYFTVPDLESAAIAFMNGTGQARGEVTREGATLVRHVTSYPQVWSRDMSELRVTSSAMTIRRGASGWFESMTGLEGFTASSIDTGRVELSVVSVAPRAELFEGASRNQADYVWENMFGPMQSVVGSVVPPNHAERVAAMRDVSMETAMEQFLVLADGNANIAAQWPDMAAFLDAHPDTIDDFATLLVTDFDPTWKAGGFLALGQTQNPAAREALLGIWRERRLPTMDRVRGSLALATRPDVGAAYAQELTGEITRKPESSEEANAARQAVLHLGVLAGTRPNDRAVADVVRSALLSQVGVSTTPHELSVVFASMGNTGDLTFLPELQKWSQHPDAEFRAVTAIGMRRMNVDLVEAFTLEWLRRETHPDVKREIFEVMHHQYTDAGKPVGEALMLEAVKHLRQQPRILTRQSIFRILEPHMSHPEVRQAMREQLKVEYEKQSGLFAFVASLLSERDVQSVLVTIPSLRDQFNGVSPVPPSQPAAANQVEPRASGVVDAEAADGR
jgi:hypothetical protein